MNNPDTTTPRHPHLAAAAALLAAPVLAAAAIAAPAAAAAPASPAAAPACHPPGHQQAPAPPGPHRQPDGRPGRGRGKTAALIGNLNPAPGSTVPAAATITFLIASQQPFPAPVSRDVTVTVNAAAVTPTAGPAESGIPVTYASRHDKKPRPASCEIPFTFTLPAAVTGTAHIQVTAHDSDGGTDTARWTYTIATTTVPTGAVGGIIVAAGGLALLAAQTRRRHTPPAHH